MNESDFDDIMQNLEMHKMVTSMAEFVAGFYHALEDLDVPEQWAAYIALQVCVAIMNRGAK